MKNHQTVKATIIRIVIQYQSHRDTVAFGSFILRSFDCNIHLFTSKQSLTLLFKSVYVHKDSIFISVLDKTRQG